MAALEILRNNGRAFAEKRLLRNIELYAGPRSKEKIRELAEWSTTVGVVAARIRANLDLARIVDPSTTARRLRDLLEKRFGIRYRTDGDVLEATLQTRGPFLISELRYNDDFREIQYFLTYKEMPSPGLRDRRGGPLSIFLGVSGIEPWDAIYPNDVESSLETIVDFHSIIKDAADAMN
jgi:hypothetical protein